MGFDLALMKVTDLRLLLRRLSQHLASLFHFEKKSQIEFPASVTNFIF